MGTIVRLTCAQCGYTETLELGAGLQAIYPEKLIPLFPQERIKNFRQVLSCGQLAYFQFEQKPGYCDHCRQWQATPTLTYRQQGNIARKVQGDCRACHQAVKLAENGPLACPLCQAQLTQETIGLWD